MNASSAGATNEDLEHVGEFLVGRGWELVDAGDPGLAAVYVASLGGADPNRPRVSFMDIGLACLCCVVGPQMVMEINPCGVINGCRGHRNGPPVCVAWNDRAQMERTLSRHERHARTLDRAALAECLIFGACSTRHRTMENP